MTGSLCCASSRGLERWSRGCKTWKKIRYSHPEDTGYLTEDSRGHRKRGSVTIRLSAGLRLLTVSCPPPSPGRNQPSVRGGSRFSFDRGAPPTGGGRNCSQAVRSASTQLERRGRRCCGAPAGCGCDCCILLGHRPPWPAALPLRRPRECCESVPCFFFIVIFCFFRLPTLLTRGSLFVGRVDGTWTPTRIPCPPTLDRSQCCEEEEEEARAREPQQ